MVVIEIDRILKISMITFHCSGLHVVCLLTHLYFVILYNLNQPFISHVEMERKDFQRCQRSSAQYKLPDLVVNNCKGANCHLKT